MRNVEYSSSNSSSAGIGFYGLLTIAFIVLKYSVGRSYSTFNNTAAVYTV